MALHSIGSYWARPIRAVFTELGQNKVPCIVLSFDVTHVAGADAQGWLDLPNPEQRDVKLFLSDKAWPYTEAKLKTIGFNGDFGVPKFSDEFMAGAEIVCTHRVDNGKTYEDWNFPHGGGEVQPAGTDAVRTMNARWRTATGIAQKPAGAPPAPGAPPMRQTVHAPAPARPQPAATLPPAQRTPAPTAPTDDEPPF